MDNPHPTDVLCGRGKKIFDHEGNQNLRAMVKPLQPEYDKLDKKGKKLIRLQVYEKVTGKFIKLENNNWIEIDEKSALEKIAQHFRSVRKTSAETQTPSETPTSIKIDPNVAGQLTQVLDDLETTCKTRTDVTDYINYIKSRSSNEHPGDDSVTNNNKKLKKLYNANVESNRIYESFNSIPPSIASASNSNNQLNLNVNQTNVNQTKQDLPCLRRFNRPFYYDLDVRNINSWEELEGRVLPGNYALRIISAYAFHCHKIYKLKAVAQRTNSKSKVYQCHSCSPSPKQSPWYTIVNRNNSGWQVRSASHRFSKNNSTSPCQCAGHQKGRLSDQLFFDCLFVRNIVNANYDRALSYIDEQVIQFFKGMELPKKSYHPKKLDIMHILNFKLSILSIPSNENMNSSRNF